MKPVAAQVAPDRRQQAKAAHAIHERAVKAKRAQDSLWPHVASAVVDMRESEGWQVLDIESFEAWLAQPEIALGQAQARKMAATFTAFRDAGFTDMEQLGSVNYPKLAVTARQVRRGKVDPERAIADAQAMPKPELEARYSTGDKLDADDEPVKEICGECGRVKPTKKRRAG